MSYEAYGPGLYFAAAAAAVFGAIMGSFLNCAADRSARGESFLTGRSRCDSCGHVLGPLELIPVVSWVLQRGKCRACGAPISIRCPVTELLCSLLTALFLLRFGFTALGLRNYVFLCCLFCASAGSAAGRHSRSKDQTEKHYQQLSDLHEHLLLNHFMRLSCIVTGSAKCFDPNKQFDII